VLEKNRFAAGPFDVKSGEDFNGTKGVICGICIF
jgi:hypothetical protein